MKSKIMSKIFMSKLLLSFGVGFVVLVFIPLKVHAGFGISPASIDNNAIKKGSKYTQEMIISRSDPDEEMVAVISTDLGDLEKWVTFEPGMRVVLPVGVQRVPIKVTINVPLDAPLKAYEGAFRVYASPEGEVKGISVVEGARVDIALTTTEVSVVELSIRAVKIPDLYMDEGLIVELTAKNDGNSPSSPSKVDVEVQTLLEQKIKDLTSTDIEKAPAYDISTIKAIFKNHGLDEGEYYGIVKVFEGADIAYQDRVVFNVLPKRVYEQVCVGASEIMANNRVAIFAGLIAVSTLVAGFGVFKLRKNTNKKKPHNRNKLIVVALVYLLLAGTAYILVYADKAGLFTRECTMEEVNPRVALNPDQTSPEPSDASIQGIATEGDGTLEDKDLNSFGQLRVGSTPEDGKYKVYKQNSLSAPVIYLAEEGEQFTVIEEMAEWYRVSLPNGIDGWLPKVNIKDSVQTEQ